MDREASSQRLSRISTIWTLVYQAHGAPADAAAAQRELMQRYGGAAHRYLLGALRDPDAADELFQEFALRFVRGDFKNARAERGRFRDFVKTALFHLVVDHQRRQQKRPRPLADDAGPAVAPQDPGESERIFLESWRDELMERTWLALQEWENSTGQPHYTVLHFRGEHPNLSSAEVAAQLGPRLGRAYSVDALRHALQRAREKFTDLLLEEVVHSLEGPSPERLEQELADLGLLTYCRAALRRRAGAAR